MTKVDPTSRVVEMVSLLNIILLINVFFNGSHDRRSQSRPWHSRFDRTLELFPGSHRDGAGLDPARQSYRDESGHTSIEVTTER
jgi:hypothetical protein